MKNKIFIISHSTGIKGPIDYYEQYLLKKNIVYKLEHPLDLYKNKKTYFFVSGKVTQTFFRYNLNIFNLGIDFLISCFF
jgi:hypothetical protein